MKDKDPVAQTVKGKFKTADELLSAYNALEREFTKRCQLIKQLQAQDDAQKAEEPEVTAAEAQEEIAAAREDDARLSHDTAIAKGSGAMPDDAAETAVKKECENMAQSAEADKAEAVTCAGGELPPQTQGCAPTTQAPEPEPAASVLDEIAEHAADYAEALSAIPQVMDACVARYKKTLIGVGAGTPARGMAVIMPARRPKTLAEAKRLADEILK